MKYYGEYRLNQNEKIISFICPIDTDVAEDIKNGLEAKIEPLDQKKKRSLNANSYFWKLCTDLSEKINIPKNEIYKNYVKEGNVFRDIEISKDAVKTFEKIWSEKGTGWICEIVDDSIKENMVILRAYYGSSCYNTKQMSRLIDLVVDDCKIQGIEVKPENEIKSLIESWCVNDK